MKPGESIKDKERESWTQKEPKKATSVSNEANLSWQPPEMVLAPDLDTGECSLPIKCYGEIPSVFFKTNTKCQCGFP